MRLRDPQAPTMLFSAAIIMLAEAAIVIGLVIAHHWK